MKRLISLIFLLPCVALADTQIIAKIAVTNAPTTNGQTIVFNGSDTRTFTNNISATATTSILTNSTAAGSATNLWTALGRAAVAGGQIYTVSGTNVFIRAALNQAIAATLAGEWGAVTYTTNTITNAYAFRVPMEVEHATNRTNIASMAVSGLSSYSTQAFATNSTALSNFLSLGPLPQRASNKTFQASVITDGGVTNSYVTNAPYVNGAVGVFTNLTFYTLANPLTNPVVHLLKATNFTGTGTNVSLSDGSAYGTSLSNVFAQDVFYIDVVNGTYASLLIDRTWNLAGTSTGDLFIENVDTGDVPVRFNPDTRFMNPVTVSNTLTVDRAFTSSNVTARTALIATNISAGGTNIIHGSLAFTSRDNTTLANGFNAAVVLGTNVDVRLSGPSGAYTNAGFALAPSGNTVYFLTIDNPGLSFALLHESGLDAAANRIITDTGAPLHSTNRTVRVILKRDESISRWTVFAFR
jgi:hypothetical protein